MNHRDRSVGVLARRRPPSRSQALPVSAEPARTQIPPGQRRSVLGRPRSLTSEQIAAVLAWHDSRVTLKQLAASLGVSTATLVHVIKSRGAHYKQAPPEERAESMNVHRAHCTALRAANLL
jgi:hypothetical protein